MSCADTARRSFMSSHLEKWTLQKGLLIYNPYSATTKLVIAHIVEKIRLTELDAEPFLVRHSLNLSPSDESYAINPFLPIASIT